MKKIFLLYSILSALIISGCAINSPSTSTLDNTEDILESTQSTQTTLSDSTNGLPHTPILSTNSFSSSSKISSSSMFENKVVTLPQTGIISEPSEYFPGNPKSHSRKPLARDLSLIIDNTREEDEIYRPLFNEYLSYHYPEYTFQVMNITNFQIDGITYKKAQAFAAESIDTSMFLYYDGNEIFDSFYHDVILRQNTMNRWRKDFRELLDPLTREIIPLKSMNLDVSYTSFEENIAKIRLDEPLDPDSNVYKRALNLYIQRDHLSLDETVTFATSILESVQALSYDFDAFYLHHQEDSGEYTRYQIPAHLINSQALQSELAKVLSGPLVESLIQRVHP